MAFEADEPSAPSAPPTGQDSEVELANDEPAPEGTPRGDSAASYALPIPGREWHFFALGAGYGALGQIDLAACRDQGLPPGYWHVRVTFGPSGRIVHASVESPVAPSRDALACVAEKLTGPSVPRFDGHGVTLSKSIFVAPAGDPGPSPQEIELRSQDPGADSLARR